MFAFDIGFAELFYTFKVILCCFINTNGFVDSIRITVFIVKLGIRRVRFIVGACCLSKVNSVYQFRGLDYPRIANVTKETMPKLGLWVRTKAVRKSAFSLYEHCFSSKANFKDEEIFVSARYPQYTPSLLEYHRVRVVIV